MRTAAFALPLLALGCVTADAPRRVGETRVESAVYGGGARSAGPVAWRLGDDARLDAATHRPAGGRPQDPQGQDPETDEQRDARLRLEFGSNVLIAADGSVTKQFFLAGDLAQTFLKLIAEMSPEKPPVAKGQPQPVPKPGLQIGGPEAKSILGRMLRNHTVEISFVPDFEVLSGARLVEVPGKPGGVVTGEPPNFNYKDAPTVSLALVTGQPAGLAAFEAALDLFYSSIPQIEISVLVIEYNTADALSFGVAQLDENTPIFNNLTSSQLVRSYSSSFPANQPIVGTTPVADIGRFALGGIHDAWELNALVEALEANNLADITSSPKMVVRNGGVAAISTLTQVPFPRAKFSQLGSEVATDIDFKPVGVRMNIIPVIAGTDSVILQVFADVSAITSFADTEPIVTPVTSQRTAVTTVYLKDGHTLVIGGLKSKTLFESETKVPILGDIPILGFLFRSTTTVRNETTVEFHITPRIVEDRGSPAIGTQF
ncbi:MAG: type II and III secretion system protein [Planctomycetes bacterium]|nr:type II and III secretion system protein [Planctomycetota bacterium]